jgi:BirA family transcriptional regulator, biotin operon repressor / biotin---[acetyl-CoA-carboxylase] ligase
MLPPYPKNKILFLNEIDSTNSFLKKLTSEKEVEDGTVILADYQTSGKGQGTNSWYGTRGLNIALSMLFKPGIDASLHFYLSEFVSLAIIDTLNFYRLNATIKWPNDVYVHDKKIAGILIENSLAKNTIKQTIVGIGLNVNEDKFPVELQNAIAMKCILKQSIDKQVVVDQMIKCLLEQYNQLISGEFNTLHERYNSLLFRRNILTDFSTADKLFKAVLKEVGPGGELILINQDNETTRYLFGEVQMRI